MATFILKQTASLATPDSGSLQMDTTKRTLALGGGNEVIYMIKSGSQTASIDLEGDITASNLFIKNNARIVGNLTFGDSNAMDTVTVVASLSSSLIPESTNAHDLGSTSKYWKTAYINAITGSLSGSVNGVDITPFSASVSQSIGNLNNTTANHTIRITNLETISSSYLAFTQSYYSVSASVSTSIGNLNNTTANHTIRIANLEQHSSSVNAYTASNNTNIANLNIISESYLNFTSSEYWPVSASISSSIGRLNNSSSINNSRIDGLELYSASLKTAIQLTGSSLTVLGDFRVIGTQSVITSENLEVKDNMIYLNATSSVTNVDIGVVGNYNDGTYAHTGVYRDAFDGVWRVFKGYQPEPSGNIDLGDPTFQLADFYANEISASISGIGRVGAYSASVAARLLNEELSSSYLSTTFSTSVDSRLDSVEATASYLNNTFSTSVDSRLDVVEATASLYVAFSTSVDSRLDLVEATASYLNTTFSTSVDSRLDSVEITSSYLNTTFSTSVDSRLDLLETFSGSEYKTDSASFDTRISASTLTYNDTTGQTGIDFTKVGTQLSAIASGLSTTSNVHFNNITASGNISSSATIYADAIVANTIAGDFPVTEFTTNGTYGSIIIKDINTRAIRTANNANFDESTFSITGSLKVSGSISASLLVGIGNVAAYSESVDIRLDSLETTFATTASLTIISASAWGAFTSASSYSASLQSTINLLSTSVDSRLDTLEAGGGFGVTDTTGQTGIDFTKTGTSISAVVSGLTTTSDVQFKSIGVGTAASAVEGEIRAFGDITAYYSSDERLKENITPIENAIDKINERGGYSYDWKEGFETIHSHKGHDLGVIAQEVQSVLPEVVNERENGYLAVDYIKLVPVLIEAIKELSAKVKELENK